MNEEEQGKLYFAEELSLIMFFNPIEKKKWDWQQKGGEITEEEKKHFSVKTPL